MNMSGKFANKVDPSYNVELSKENQAVIGKHLQWGHKEMNFKETKIGDPVWYVYRHPDGTIERGWGLLCNYAVDGKYCIRTLIGQLIKVDHFYQEKPARDVKEEIITDLDGNEIKVSYGDVYDDTLGADVPIFAIDTPFETVSFVLTEDGVDTLIKAIRKVRA
jgi:hypothetical protein